ncbi:MAG: hypothetical protein M3P04_14790 [Actinomycetota bacterium]|nr:hypothetical protein [Actinomycetota bacterium]
MTWTWNCSGPDGEPMTPAEVTDGFLTQAEAEDWIGVAWRELREAGVGSVTLLEDDRVVYGPMSLDPV